MAGGFWRTTSVRSSPSPPMRRGPPTTWAVCPSVPHLPSSIASSR